VVDSPNDIQIFDRGLLKTKRARASKGFAEYDFLFKWVADNLRDRLEVIKRDHDVVVQLGGRGGSLIDGAHICDLNDAYSPTLIGDSELLPFAPNSVDCIISALDLHSVNDLPGALLQIRKALKADGLFIAALFGGETLHELRASLSATEMELKGGLSPRVFPFADKQELGALLQRAGFALPVVDSEIVTVTYEHIFKLLTDLRGMGESNVIAARDKRYVGKEFFMKAAQHYAEQYAESDGRIPASFEIIFLIGWAPHESQQKPLQPGSAKERLADALETQEEKL
jgi:SAM-dependent methyltransferase